MKPYLLLITLIILMSSCTKKTEDNKVVQDSTEANILQSKEEQELNSNQISFDDFISKNIKLESFTIVDNDYYTSDKVDENYLHIHIDTIWTATDLDKDDYKDILLTGYENTGGSGCWVFLGSVLNKNKLPYLKRLIYFGDRVAIDSVKIENDTIKVYSLVHREEDGLCCPSLPFVFLIKNESGDLIQLNDKPKAQ